MNLINKLLFVVNSVLISIVALIGIYASKDYSFSVLTEIIRSLIAIKDFL